jgi:hypothetical protein
MTPKFKPGDKVRVVKNQNRVLCPIGEVWTVKGWLTDREQYNTSEPYYVWPEEYLELVDPTPTVTIEQAIKVLTDAGYVVTKPEPTSIRDWKPGDCGVEKDGTKWYRTEDGAIVDTGTEVSVWQDELLLDFPVAIKNPKLKLTLNWSES